MSVDQPSQAFMEISVNGSPLTKAEMAHITSVTVKDAVDKLDSGSVTFELPQGTGESLATKLKVYGKALTIVMKRQPGTVVRTFSFDVMSITWTRSAGAPRTCTLTGIDRLHRTKRGRPDAKADDRRWTGKKVTEIVTDVAKYWSFGTSQIGNSNAMIEQELKWDKDDAALLMYLAEKYNHTLRVDAKSATSFDVVFQEHADYANMPAVELEFGVHILDVNATHTLDGCLNEVTFTGKKALDGAEPVTHTCKSGDVTPLHNAKMGADFLKEAGFKPFVEAIEDESGQDENQSNVQEIAKARMTAAAESFVSGQLTCRFTPELTCGRKIKIKGAGWPLDGVVVVQEVTHSLEPSGYRSQVTFKANSIA